MAQPLTNRVRRHYDRLAPLYRRLWGEHVHHGYWDLPGLSPARAQERLTEVLAEAAGVPQGARVLDVGCGFGGSTRWLAEYRAARVLGWTLSRAQARFAAARARAAAPAGGAASAHAGGRRRGSLLVAQADAETWPARDATFDVVWIIECLEHLHDKPRALARSAQALRPGGALALCAWMAGPAFANGRAREVAEAFLCPELASPGEHARWAEAAGLRVEIRRDLTPHVRPTWDHARRSARRLWVRALVPFLDRDTRRFVRGFDLMARAYDEGSLVYGLLVARRP